MPAAGRVNELRNHMVDRLRFERVETHGGQVGLLAGNDRTDTVRQADRARSIQRRRLKRECRIECAGVTGDALGQQCRGAHLAEHVEVVVAGAAVGADRQIDARAAQLFRRAEAAGELEVGLRAMHDARAGLGELGDFAVEQLRHVHGDQVVVDEAERVHARLRPHAMLLA
jgi:hypothetical protein